MHEIVHKLMYAIAIVESVVGKQVWLHLPHVTTTGGYITVLTNKNTFNSTANGIEDHFHKHIGHIPGTYYSSDKEYEVSIYYDFYNICLQIHNGTNNITKDNVVYKEIDYAFPMKMDSSALNPEIDSDMASSYDDAPKEVDTDDELCDGIDDLSLYDEMCT